MIILIVICTLLLIPFLHGFINGVSTSTEPKQKNQDKQIIDSDTIENEIILLEINLERRKEAAAILESELQHCRPNRKATILTKLNTLDKQSYKDMERINKLKELL